MSAGDPYRTSAGPSCPRCRNVLARETDGELRCTQNGCGTWLPKKLVDDIVGMDTVARSKGNPFRATPLPPTKCLVCKRPLNDLYKGAHDVLTIGQCVEHGIWIERSSRSDLEALFAPERRARDQAREAAAAPEADVAEVQPVTLELIFTIYSLYLLIYKTPLPVPD